MKKIFFIINSFSMGGGAESLLTQIVNHLNPNKYKVGIMEIIHDDVKKEPVNDNVMIYPYYTLADAPDRKSRMYYVYHEWDKVISEYIPPDYDLYVSFNYLKPTFLLPKGKKCIAWIHGDVYNLAQDNLQEERALQNESLYKANKIVTISDITTQSIIDLFPEHKEKIRVIYNGVNIRKINDKSKEFTVVKLQHPAIMSVGRLDANKNPLRLLNIFEKVYHKKKDAHLYYLGFGDLGKEVERLARDKGINDNVHLLGYYDNPFPIIAQCDINCMFSVSEGFGLAIAEGLCLGVPFVGAEIGALDLLSNKGKCGRIIQNDDEAAETILRMLQEDKGQLAEECRESIKRFELKEYIRRIEELFDEVMGD